MWNTRQSKLSAVKQNAHRWEMPRDRSRREKVYVIGLGIEHTSMISSYFLQRQKRSVYAYGGALTVTHILEDCSDLEELRQRHRLKGNLKQHFGSEQLAICLLYTSRCV